jgi:hypothetical protein
MQELIEKIIETRLKKLLEIISKNYPTKFKHKDINKEIDYLKKHILFKPNKKKIIKPKKTIVKGPPLETKIETSCENQCHARVWNNYIFDRKTKTKVEELPDIFKVDDFKDINIKNFNSNYIIGLQCKKKNDRNGNSKYCKLHSIHLIHGDFTEIPSKEICYHFIKDGKYL